MEYESLLKSFYKNRHNHEKNCEIRRNSISTELLDFYIDDIQCFYMATPEIISLTEEILTSNSRVVKLFHRLPNVAKATFANQCLIDEIIGTNDTEGVRSTRSEVREAIRRKPAKSVRFSGLAHKYIMILNHENIPLNTCSDIRSLYNDIVFDEVSEEDKPDGIYFRKDSSSVVNSADKEIHRGVNPEAILNTCMESALRILNNAEIPLLVRTAIFHYMFGYMHPFYDGNGRMSRFISSVELSQILDETIALRLSYSVKENLSNYYKAFDICNDMRNNGDLTPFVIMFLEIVKSAANDINETLILYIDKLDYYYEVIKKIEFKSELQRDILWFFIQDAIFGKDYLSMEELCKLSGKSDATVRSSIEMLIEMNIPVVKKKDSRKLVYGIDLNKWDCD